MSWQLFELDDDVPYRACPVCLNRLWWRHPTREKGKLSLGHAWCKSHGRLRRWYVIDAKGSVVAIGSGDRNVRGRLLRKPTPARRKHWNATSMRRYAPRYHS